MSPNKLLILLLLTLGTAGCGPVWRVNGWTIERQRAELGRPLSSEESEWAKSLFETRSKLMPMQVGEWQQRDASYSFIAGSEASVEHRILGLHFRYAYQNGSGQSAVIYQFINPVYLKFNDVLIGQYTYSHYYYPKSYALKGDGAYIFSNRFLVPIEDLANEDRSYFEDQTTNLTHGYFGMAWMVETCSTNPSKPNESHFSLKVRPDTWRREIYAEYWLMAAPSQTLGEELVQALSAKVRNPPAKRMSAAPNPPLKSDPTCTA